MESELWLSKQTQNVEIIEMARQVSNNSRRRNEQYEYQQHRLMYGGSSVTQKNTYRGGSISARKVENGAMIGGFTERAFDTA